MDEKIILVEDVDRDAQKRWRLFYWILFGVSAGAVMLGFKIWSDMKANALNNYYYSAQFQSYSAQPLAYPQPGAGGCCAAGGPGAGGCGGGGTGGCGGGGTALAAADLQKIQEDGLKFYREQTGDNSQVEAKVQDFGCHIQVDIYKNGSRIKSYAWRGGQFSQIQ